MFRLLIAALLIVSQARDWPARASTIDSQGRSASQTVGRRGSVTICEGACQNCRLQACEQGPKVENANRAKVRQRHGQTDRLTLQVREEATDEK